MKGLSLKIKRLEAGLKQYELAAALGIPQASLSYYENEQRPIPPEREAQILAVIEQLGRKKRGRPVEAHYPSEEELR